MKINLRILELLAKSKELHAELKTSTISKRRKGRIYKLIDEKKEKHQEWAKILCVLLNPYHSLVILCFILLENR